MINNDKNTSRIFTESWLSTQQNLINLPRGTKRIIWLVVDLFLIVFSVWFSYVLRTGVPVSILSDTNEYFPAAAVVVCLVSYLPALYWSGLQRSIVRYFTTADLKTSFIYLLLPSMLVATLLILVGISGVPRTIGIIQPLVFLILVYASRYFARTFLGFNFLTGNEATDFRRIIIVGAGARGLELAKLLQKNERSVAVCFVDDDQLLAGGKVAGLDVYTSDELHDLIERFKVTDLVFETPELLADGRVNLLNVGRELKLMVHSLPEKGFGSHSDLRLFDLRHLSIEGILGRQEVDPIPSLLQHDITEKVVLVTGAGGSIGKEICKSIIRQKPRAVILFEQSEFALYGVGQEIDSLCAEDSDLIKPEIQYVLGTILDKNYLKEIITKNRVDTIYHAAAYKHVHLVEANPIEGVKVNFVGTVRLLEAACKAQVKKLVLISTDKAVNPTNYMGGSKRLAELAVHFFATKYNKTDLAIVRFGNVMNSSGSVIPLFARQIKNGGPVTVTHPDVERYFMTINEAAQLVIQAGALVQNQSHQSKRVPVYILDMGEPIKILDLARQMIELYKLQNFSVDRLGSEEDINITFGGLRPGEKLFEELSFSDELKSTAHPRIFIDSEDLIQEDLDEMFEHLIGYCKTNSFEKIMKKFSAYFDLDA